MKKISLLALILVPLLFAAACGGGSNGPAPKPVGNFSNSSLKGQYAYRLEGFDYSSNTFYAEAGTFTADGNGNITAGTDDFMNGALTTTTTTGQFAVSSDGTGSLTLANTGLGNALGLSGITLAITLTSNSQLYLIEEDVANTYGMAELQAPSTLGTTPSGSYAFRQHDAGIASRVGAFTVASGALTGSEDLLVAGALDNGTSTPLPITGTLIAPVGGRGTGSFSDGVSNVSFIYYVVDANNIRILRTDAGFVSLGRAEKQSGTFTNSAFLGNYVFASRADDTNANGGVNGQNTVGLLTADGSGNITGGSYDSLQDSGSLISVPINAGTTPYSVASNGRLVVNYSVNTGASTQQVFWLVNSSRAFFLTNDSTKYEDGVADLQTTSSFSNSSLSGQYAFAMDGFIPNVENLDRVGWIQGDGKGNLSWFEDANSGPANGNSSSVSLTGTYAVGSNGRATGTVSDSSGSTIDVVFYLVSPSQFYVIQGDSGTQIFGGAALQPAGVSEAPGVF